MTQSKDSCPCTILTKNFCVKADHNKCQEELYKLEILKQLKLGHRLGYPFCCASAPQWKKTSLERVRSQQKGSFKQCPGFKCYQYLDFQKSTKRNIVAIFEKMGIMTSLLCFIIQITSVEFFFLPSITSRRCVMNMYIFCKITKKIWFGGFNADNYEETIISFFFL